MGSNDKPDLRLDRLHMFDVDDTVDVLPASPAVTPRIPRRRNSLFVDVPEHVMDDPKSGEVMIIPASKS